MATYEAKDRVSITTTYVLIGIAVSMGGEMIGS